MKDAETGQRGYLLTGDDTYLEPYRSADASIDNVIKQLRDLIADDPIRRVALSKPYLSFSPRWRSSNRPSSSGAVKVRTRP